MAPKGLPTSEDLRRLARAAPALTVLVLLFQGVAPLVSGEVGTPSEGFPTLPALIGLLSGVDSLVYEEEGVVTEGFATLATREGLLSGVTALGNLEDPVPTAGGPALSLPSQGVLLLMDHKGRPVDELLRAFAAAVQLLACVNPLVIEEGFLPSESFPTLLTQESLLRQGGALGLTAAAGLPGVFSTLVLMVELLFLMHSHVAGKV